MGRHIVDNLAALGAFIVIVLGLWAFGTLVLHQPAPACGISGGQQVQDTPANAEGGSSNSQRQTESPAPVSRVIAGSQPSAEAAKPATDCDEKASTDRWTLIWVGLTALFTGLLFVVGSVQAALFLWQLRLIKDSIKDAATAAKAAERSAITAERALTELERPFIVFAIKDAGLHVSAQGAVTPKGMLVSQFENIGRTPAILVEHCDNVLVVPRRNGFPNPISPENPQIGMAHHTTFPVGFAVGPKLNYRVRENMIRKPMEDPLWDNFANNNGARDHLYIHGFIRYADIFGARYLMGYCAIFDPISNRFVLMGGAQHNYFRQEARANLLSADAQHAQNH